VTLRIGQSGAWTAVVLATNVVSWRVAIITLATLTVSGVLQVFIERQRQRAFRAITVGVPEGSVVTVQYGGGPGGRGMRAGLSKRGSRQMHDGT
jgi:hypothetical protein